MIKSTIILTMGNLLSSSVHGQAKVRTHTISLPYYTFFFQGTYPRSISLFEVPWCLRPLFHLTKLSISNILSDKVHEVRYLHGNTMAIRVRTLIASYNYKREKIELSPQYCCCITYCAKLQPESNWNIILLKTPITN